MEIITHTETYTVYEFLELSEATRQRVKDRHAANNNYANAAEALESLRLLAEHFDGVLVAWEIDWGGGSGEADFEMPEMSRREIGRRLNGLGTYDKKTLKGHGDCALTGVCTDEDAIDGFRWAFVKDRRVCASHRLNLEDYMDKALESLLKSCREDYLAFYEDENFAEHCDANDNRFMVDGYYAPRLPRERVEPKPMETGRPGRSLLRRKKGGENA